MPFEESFARGQELAAIRKWGEAAEAFTAAARLAEGSGDAPRAWQAWDAAGEAWRREDCPDAAAMADAQANGARFIHSDGGRNRCVVSEPVETAPTLRRSRWREFANLSADDALLQKWLFGGQFPTVVRL